MVCIGSAKSLNGTSPNRHSSSCRLRDLLNWLNLNPFWPTPSKHSNGKSHRSPCKATHFPHAICHRTLTLSDYQTCDRRSAPYKSLKMDSAEPEQTPFAAVSAQTTKLGRVCSPLLLKWSRMLRAPIVDLYGQIYQSYLDKCTPYTAYRWIGTAVLLSLFFVRILVAQGWYIGALAYSPTHLTALTNLHQSLLFPRNLPPQPLPRLPATQIRSISLPRRRSGRR